MAYDELKTALEKIEKKACLVADELQDALDALEDIKKAADEALEMDAPAGVPAIIESIKTTACQTYTTLAQANAALVAIKALAQLAISMLGK